MCECHLKKALPLLLVIGGVAALLAVSAMTTRAAEEEQKLKIGDALPDFSLPDYEGATHALSALKDKIVVLAFTSQKCPYSRAGDPRLAAVATEYAGKGVVFLSIDSHNDTSIGEIKKYATEENETGGKLPYPILKDAGNVYADAVHAKRTPEIYIADKAGKLVYHGALDNQKKPDEAGYVNYVATTLDEALEGKAVSKPETGAYGCTIKRVAK